MSSVTCLGEDQEVSLPTNNELTSKPTIIDRPFTL